MSVVTAPRRLDLGAGIYTIGDAARLLQRHPRTVQAWAEGYSWVSPAGERAVPPVLDRSVSTAGLLTFRELVELLFVREFHDAGVKMAEIRAAAVRLRDEWATPYPFANQMIETDGWQLLASSGGQYRKVVDQQQVFVFARQFFRNIEVDEGQLAIRWWPMGQPKLIALDPNRKFGTPIEFRSGIRTDVLFNAYEAEGSYEAVSEWYELDREGVQYAVEFERQWMRRAA